MITLDRLKYFVAAAKLEHVGQAASQLHTSPSVVSSAIKELEIAIGQSLFNRRHNRIKITIEGRALLEKAQKVLDEIEQIAKPSSSPVMTGHYRIGASHFLMQQLLVPAFLKLKGIHPAVTAEFVSLDSGLALSQVRAGSLDCALVFRSSYSERTIESVLHEGFFDIYLKRKHAIFAKSKKGILGEINRLPALAFRSSSGANFWESHPAFAKLGIIPSHQYFYDDTATALQLLEESGGWAFLPNLIEAGTKHIRALNLINRATAPVNVSLVSGSGVHATSFVQKLEPFLRKKLTEILR